MPQTKPGNKFGACHGERSMSTAPFPSLRPPRWPRRITQAGLAIIAVGLLLSALAGPLNRFHLAGVGVALMTLVIGLGVVVLGTATSIIGVLAATVKGARIPGTAAVVGIIIGLAVSAYVLSWVVRAQKSPPINDITTDLTNPPQFVAVLPLRARAHATAPAQYQREVPGPGGKMIDVPKLQAQYYPYIKPLLLSLPPAQALARARHVAEAMGWRIDAYVPADGRLEATAHTFFFDFKDDIVVRVRPNGTGARIDVRSESRVGLSDLGTNAARIRLFMKRMQAH
jgi:uncharacterized protein (DUF1499 family)